MEITNIAFIFNRIQSSIIYRSITTDIALTVVYKDTNKTEQKKYLVPSILTGITIYNIGYTFSNNYLR